MDPEIPLSQAEEEKSPARVAKALDAGFDPSEKWIRSGRLFSGGLFAQNRPHWQLIRVPYPILVSKASMLIEVTVAANTTKAPSDRRSPLSVRRSGIPLDEAFCMVVPSGSDGRRSTLLRPASGLDGV
jgi:hypothetical protein